MKVIFSTEAKHNIIVIATSQIDDLSKITIFDKAVLETIKEQCNFFKFQGKDGESCNVTIEHQGTKKYLVIIGYEAKDNIDLVLLKLGGQITKHLQALKFTKADVFLSNEFDAKLTNQVALGALLRNYSFNKYKSLEKLKNKITLETINFINQDHLKAHDLYMSETKFLADSIYFSKDLVTEPANIIYPETFVAKVKEEFKDLAIKIEVLGEEQLKQLGMNALVGVGQGSFKESKLLVMSYQGASPDDAPIAFVGKGVTFDTGGISLKPATNMEDMKYDMAGASIVTGLIRNLASRKAKVNIVAIAGLVENMPDGNAQRPSDVVKSMSGQTIEIINTDAEGRLVLADALWYCQDRFKPKIMINLATLTGAIIIALGSEFAGLFANDETLAGDLIKSGLLTDEKLWQLPLDPAYDKLIDSNIADVRNTSTGRGAGSITAAKFLERFVNKTSWAHLDIAAVTWNEKDSAISPSGATGFGLRLLDNFIRKYES